MSSRRLDIGVASYGSPEKLRVTLETIRRKTTAANWRCFVIDNPYNGDILTKDDTTRAIMSFVDTDKRFVPMCLPENIGYAGAVNKLLELAETDYIAYFDNDIEILTPGWDEHFMQVLDANPECGWVFPGAGHYGFHNGRYHECLWSAGYAWMLRRSVFQRPFGSGQTTIGDITPLAKDPALFDTTLGHHEEVDYMIRMRLAGFNVGCCPQVSILHHETSTRSPESEKRIHDGVVRWMNKWNRYFCGDVLKYSMTEYDPRALRYTDWPPCALYLERMTLHYFPRMNREPEQFADELRPLDVHTVSVPGVGEMDAVRVLKPKGPYRGRAI